VINIFIDLKISIIYYFPTMVNPSSKVIKYPQNSQKNSFVKMHFKKIIQILQNYVCDTIFEDLNVLLPCKEGKFVSFYKGKQKTK
jgi:hypothetical protein